MGLYKTSTATAKNRAKMILSTGIHRNSVTERYGRGPNLSTAKTATVKNREPGGSGFMGSQNPQG